MAALKEIIFRAEHAPLETLMGFIFPHEYFILCTSISKPLVSYSLLKAEF
jgi:hypothetical protein